jgi:hypothetical protein
MIATASMAAALTAASLMADGACGKTPSAQPPSAISEAANERERV